MSGQGLALGAPLLLLALAGCATGHRAERDYLAGYQAAEAARRPFAPITETAPATTLAQAYRLQSRLAASRVARGDRVAGYRGGLVSRAAMAGRGVEAPLAGVLFASGLAADGASISLCGYRRMVVELKLGFRFARAVRTPPRDVESLARAVGGVGPVVDLPDIAYRDPDHYGAADMVAANISAARDVLGVFRPAAGLDLDALSVSLTRDGQVVTSGRGRESLDDQWGSLLAVTEQILASGRTIAAGDLVLTGRMGARPWMAAGAYRADYGPLGVVAFTVRDCDKAA